MPEQKTPKGRFYTVGPLVLPGLPPERTLRVYVPPSSAETTRRRTRKDEAIGERPTLVLFDGQNVFEDEGSFSGGWHAHLAVDALVGSRTAEAPVVIGVPHGGERRLVELSAWPIQGKQGRADELLDWLVGEAIPRVRSELGLEMDPRATVIGGSSMGGLASLYGHLRHPDVFGGALVMSPSLFVGGSALREWIARRPRPVASRLYLDAGAHEGNGRLLRSARTMAALLARCGWGDGDLLFVTDEHGKHHESDWRRRLPRALRFLFAKRGAR